MLTTLRNLPTWQRTLWITFFAQLCSAVGFSIIFPFLPLYVEDLGTSTDLSIEFWAGMVFSSQAITMMIASPFWGALADRYGRKLMVQRAMFGGTIIIAMMAFVANAEQLVIVRAIQGLITGTVSAANALVAAAAPRDRTGYAMSIIQVGLWSGVAVGPLIGGVLADAFGYRLPFLITAGLLFFAGVLVHFGVHEEFTPQTKAANQNKSFWQEWKHIVSVNGVLQTYVIRFMSGLARSMVIPITPLFVAYLVTSGATEGMVLPLPPAFADYFAQAAGISTYTGLVVGLASATSTASAVYLGRLGDRIGHRVIVTGSALLALLLYIPQGFVSSPVQLLFLQAMTGFAMGGLVAAPSALLALYTEAGEEGAVYGLDNSVVAAARAIAPLLGASFAVWFGLRLTFLSMSGVFLIVLVVSLVLLPSREATQRQMALQPSAAD